MMYESGTLNTIYYLLAKSIGSVLCRIPGVLGESVLGLGVFLLSGK